ncbi:uncharacterized protein [Triticum aestivum]|uniref:uncharacterized protein isoform X2 n=1 Tax=Triticum aestivum TaxID=4565 RepID=UPI001D010BD1|nr:uncharacterized protein LOC123060401 isoform X2 [Triticum aestivum]XP_044339039.1 uncharacterized protein LOC123060401 isoform X2 [Triticum aestivum]
MAVHKDVRTPSRALFDRRTSRGKANRGDDVAPEQALQCSAFNDFGAACLDHQRQFELLSEVLTSISCIVSITTTGAATSAGGAGRRRADAITHARSDGMVAEEGRLLGSRALAAISTRGHTNKTGDFRVGSV